MNAHELTNLVKAARAGLAHYATPDTWHSAIVNLAKANRQPGETPEQAEVRMLREDSTVRQFDIMRREALAMADVQKAKGGRPRKYHPTGEQAAMTDAEDRLAKRAMARAQRDGTSFEKAFVAEIDTPEGRELYIKTRVQL